MVSIVREDDILSPEMTMIVRYNGPNPYQAYQHTKGWMRDIWRVEAKDFWEREFRWDSSGDPRGFFVRAFVVRGVDRFSKVIIEVVMQGAQPSNPKKPGPLEIKLTGTLQTTFGNGSVLQDARNPIFRFLVWTYARYFYREQRKFYIRKEREKLNLLKGRYEELLGIKPPFGR